MSTLIQSAPDFICKLDLQGKICFVNRPPQGVEQSNVIGFDWSLFIVHEYQNKAQESFKSVIKNGHTVEYEALGTSNNDIQTWYSVRLAPIFDHNEIIGAVLIARDVNEKKQTESQLVSADRMATIGTLVAGVAHEINNPLAAVILNLEIIMSELFEGKQTDSTLPPGLKERLLDTHKAVNRIGKIVNDLKVFSHQEEDHRSSIDVENLIDATLRIAWNELRHRAQLIKNYSGIPPVYANEGRLGQVLLNLLINATQAIPEDQLQNNTITITTSVTANQQALISIKDTGRGISPDHYKNIFTPFYTTKPKGVGTGLGLSISHRIIKSLGGEITFESEMGRGTEFKITLPLVHLNVYSTSEASLETDENIKSERSKVLIVDDEVTFSSVLEGVLADDHEVTTAESGEEVLALLAEGLRYNVIISDIMMPFMTGKELYHKVQSIDPQQAERMVFMTGGAFTPSMRDFLDSVKNKKIEKPFRLKELRNLMSSISRK